MAKILPCYPLNLPQVMYPTHMIMISSYLILDWLAVDEATLLVLQRVVN